MGALKQPTTSDDIVQYSASEAVSWFHSVSTLLGWCHQVSSQHVFGADVLQNVNLRHSAVGAVLKQLRSGVVRDERKLFYAMNAQRMNTSTTFLKYSMGLHTTRMYCPSEHFYEGRILD